MYYYKFHISDWLVATSHLSLEEEAIYFRLLNFYYDTEQPIPAETQSVLRRLRLGSKSDTVRIILEEFFELLTDGWHHKRCDAEIAEYHLNAEKNRVNGMRGGRPKKSKTQSVIFGNPNETPTINDKPLTINQDKPIGGKRAAQLPADFKPSENHTSLAISLGIDVAKEFAQFADHHKAKGSTMKDWDAALRTWIRNAAKFSKQQPARKQENIWSGFDNLEYGKSGALK